MLLKEFEVDIRLLNIYLIKITSLLPLSSDIATIVDILQLWVQSIWWINNQQEAIWKRSMKIETVFFG